MFNWFARLLGFGARCVPSPILGQAIFEGEGHEAYAAEDLAVLGKMFEKVSVSRGSVPGCGVLLVYATIDLDGHLSGTSQSLRDIIRESGAWVVVVATNNPGEHCLAACASTGYGEANLVLVLDRKGPLFNQFFGALFQQMMSGVSMPVAWVRLAPQNPHGPSHQAPETVFLCERGQVVLPRH